MTKENAKELLPIIRAFAKGKTIEFYTCGEWRNFVDYSFMGKLGDYRIKSEVETVKK